MSEHWPYLSIFAVLVAAGLGLPIPEDIPLLTAGFFCYAGFAEPWLMIVVTMVGVLGGDLVLFAAGRRFGEHIVERPFFRRWVRRGRLRIAERLFRLHGLKIIFVGRFLPGLRPMIFLASGVLKVRPWQFIAVDGFAALISVPTLVLLGYWFGNHIDAVTHGVRQASHTVLSIAAIITLLGLGYYFYRRQRYYVNQASGTSNTTKPRKPDRRAPDLRMPRTAPRSS